jgi:hypothetical protein
VVVILQVKQFHLQCFNHSGRFLSCSLFYITPPPPSPPRSDSQPPLSERLNPNGCTEWLHRSKTPGHGKAHSDINSLLFGAVVRPPTYIACLCSTVTLSRNIAQWTKSHGGRAGRQPSVCLPIVHVCYKSWTLSDDDLIQPHTRARLRPVEVT